MANYPIRFYQKSHQFDDDNQPIRDRESYVLITDGLAIEGWRAQGTADPILFPSGYFGGVEKHSATPLYEGQEPMPGPCQWVKGGTCYHDGSSMAFDEIQYGFDSPDFMYAELARWLPDGDQDTVLSALRGDD